MTGSSGRPAPSLRTALTARAATRTARELMPVSAVPDPEVARTLVADLRDAAATATDLVLDIMRLDPGTEDRARNTVAAGEIVVVDRLGWAGANARMFAGLLPEEARGGALGTVQAALARGAGTVTGAELGAALAFLGPRVLGQFDPFGAGRGADAGGAGRGESGAGRLLLVAPNVLEHERALAAKPRDFRLWVALHERTHQVQFAAAPWLRETLRSHTSALLAAGPDLDPARLDAVITLMSVLEGHADVVMDAVPRRTLPSGRRLRKAFDARRSDTSSGIARLLGSLLGLEGKLAQYTQGAEFVRAVVRERGHVGLRPLWDEPSCLPTAEELADPEQWLRRVPGSGA
ncbi:zinc-dependent metalloprotease [Brevibacterium samyangense]|uniref:zinc-dependent metalloprotease n=1 Tax=Brevibacterium samyangense TaxID=366888 RepID=UPI0031D21DF2